MTRLRKCLKFSAKSTWRSRALPYRDEIKTSRTLSRTPPVLMIYSQQRSSDVAAGSSISTLHTVASTIQRDANFTHILRNMGDSVSGGYCVIHLIYSQYRCRKCCNYFNADISDQVLAKTHDTHCVVSLAVRFVVEDSLSYATSWHLWHDQRVFVPSAPNQIWVETGGEKGGWMSVSEILR